MSLTVEQADAFILKAFYNMEEGVEYVLNDFWFTEINRLRKEYGYSLLNSKKEYQFSRKGEVFYVNNKFVFNFIGKSNLALDLALAIGVSNAAFAFCFSLAFCLALQHNGFEKLNKDTCEGKVVEIDGRKYKLTAV